MTPPGRKDIAARGLSYSGTALSVVVSTYSTSLRSMLSSVTMMGFCLPREILGRYSLDVPALQSSPSLDDLRKDARYRELLKKMRLETESPQSRVALVENLCSIRLHRTSA